MKNESWKTIGASFKPGEIQRLNAWIGDKSRNAAIREVILTALQTGLDYDSVLITLTNAVRLNLLLNEKDKLRERSMKLREEVAELKTTTAKLKDYEEGLRQRILRDFITTPTSTSLPTIPPLNLPFTTPLMTESKAEDEDKDNAEEEAAVEVVEEAAENGQRTPQKLRIFSSTFG